MHAYTDQREYKKHQNNYENVNVILVQVIKILTTRFSLKSIPTVVMNLELNLLSVY